MLRFDAMNVFHTAHFKNKKKNNTLNNKNNTT